MQAIKISQWILRISGIIVLVLGILFWINVVDASGGIVLVHMLLGILVVLSLWTLGILQGLRAGGSFGLAMATFIWGLLTLAVGLFQTRWLLDPSQHWIIQVIHLILGLGAIGLGEMVAGRAKRQANKPMAV